MGAPSSDDADLLRGVHDGEHAAFACLFDRHARWVHAYCARRCEDAQAADDALSIVFMEAWRSRSRAGLAEGSLRPWLAGISRNVVLHQRRSARRYAAALDRYSRMPAAEEADHADAVVAAVAAPAVAADVHAAVAKLPKRERDVVELCLLGEMSVSGAAAALGLAEGTVKSRLFRARRRLARLLRTSEHPNHAPAAGNASDRRPPVASIGGHGL